MHRRALFFAALVALGGAPAARALGAETAPSAYASFTAGAQPQRGLFTIWRKGGKVFLELRKDQLGADFVESIVPGNGLGGNFVVWGNTDHLPAQLVRFEREGDKIALVWPNTNFVADDPGVREALARNFPQSVVGMGDVVAEDASTGAVVFDATTLLDADTLDLNSIINQSLRTNPGTAYRFNSALSFFGNTKAFPNNVLIEANQTWSTQAPHVADVAPDAHNIQMRVEYNFAQPPGDAGYMPRFADDRVGIYDAIYLQFNNDLARTRKLRYVVRWNLAPSDPSKAISPATHPMVMYLSDTIPAQYRPAIRDAALMWNRAFEKIGISDAVQVREQPNDPNWDPDDIRYNVIRWTTEASSSFGADSQTLFDPRTGQEFRTGILVSADSATGAAREWRDVIDPVRYGRHTDPVPAQFIYDSILSEIMHEMGHNLGLQHNFIGSEAYTAAQLQSQAFTRKYGITSTVMEYAPANVWPKPFGQGTFEQTVLGPYDYYAIKWAYARIPGATTPAQELPTLERWAQAWSDPRYRYASDEDVAWYDGHAADPRSNQGDLTNDPLSWCAVQMKMYSGLMHSLNGRAPAAGSAYEDETAAFTGLLSRYLSCAALPAHFIGGQYLSRAHAGDPGAQPPVVPVPRAQERRAFTMLANGLFSSAAFDFSPRLLSRLGYSEWAGYGYVSWPGYGNLPIWAYNPPERHDVPLVERVNAAQMAVVNQLFQPLVLARIDDNPLEATTPTMSMHDLFAWLQDAIYGNLQSASTSSIRRNLQIQYADRLAKLAVTPGIPADAQGFARFELGALRSSAATALRSGSHDATWRAHLENLAAHARAH